MKKITLFFLLSLFCFAMTGCGDHGSDIPGSHEKNVEIADHTDPIQERNWSEQEILSMFTDCRENGWEYIDCVLIPDYAYDRVGAVLFRNTNQGTCDVAFFNSQGHFQKCGVYALPAEHPEFFYLGDGAVSFQMKTENGQVYLHTLTLSIQENQVQFKTRDDLISQE